MPGFLNQTPSEHAPSVEHGTGALTPEMVKLLKVAAAQSAGKFFGTRNEDEKHHSILMEMKRLGYMRWDDIACAIITEEGRAAIGAPTEIEAGYARYRAAKTYDYSVHKPSRQPKPIYRQADQICLLLDMRGQARPNSLQVWSYSKGRVVSLPRSMIEIESRETKRWAAVSVPRWLAAREGLYGCPKAVPNEFCTPNPDPRSEQQKRDDGEQSLVQCIVDNKNRYSARMGAPGKVFEKQLLPEKSA